MSRTLTAMFDNRSDAENAQEQLIQAGIDAGDISIVDHGSTGMAGTGTMSDGTVSDGTVSGAVGTAAVKTERATEGFWHSLKNMFVDDDDRNAYAEGIRRGGYLLSADVEEAHADRAIDILDNAGSIDFDARQSDWRSGGWTGGSTAGAAMGAMDRGRDSDGRTESVAEESIPIVQEELRVGKREVARGGARVRSYVREIPVNEQVSLREEHVSVERRPVDRALNADELSGDLMRDRTIEMTETAEEATIGKEARVIEEVVVRKTADTRVETINDTVRRTEVEVDNDPVQKFAGVSSESVAGMRATDTDGRARQDTIGTDRDNTTGNGRVTTAGVSTDR